MTTLLVGGYLYLCPSAANFFALSGVRHVPYSKLWVGYNSYT